MNELLKRTGYLQSQNMVWSREGYCGIPYSDGDDVEMRIYNAVCEAQDVSLFSCELKMHCTDWPSIYHLSPTRANLLRPFSADMSGKDILEIGAGCGAITRFLGESGANVLALEGSRRRASIAAQRTRDLENVTIISDDFNAFHVDHKFDVITLIGVLEYAPLFTEGEHPVQVFLKRVATLLNPSGKLILAIENQLGLKYFAGFPEDHVGRPMYGVEALYEKSEPITFGKKDLINTLNHSGFSSVKIYAPFPDYKLPVALIGEEGFCDSVFDAAALAWQTARSDRQIPACYSLVLPRVWPEVIRNGLGLDMANSFLFVAGMGETALASGTEENALAYYFTSERRLEYCKQAVFRKTASGAVSVDVTPLGSIPFESNTADILTFKLPKTSKYCEAPLLMWEFIDVVTRENWSFEHIKTFLQRYISCVEKIAFQESETYCVFDDLDLALPPYLFDCIPQNIILNDQSIPTYFDAEWIFNEELNFGYLLFRCLLQMTDWVSLFGVNNLHQGLSQKSFIIRSFEALGYQMDEERLLQYENLERRVQSQVTGLPNLVWKLSSSPFYNERRSFAALCNVSEQLQFRDNEVRELIPQVKVLTTQLAQRDGQVQMLLQLVAQKDGQLQQKDGQLQQKDGQLQQKDEQLQLIGSELHTVSAKLEHQRIEQLYYRRRTNETIYKMIRPVRCLKRLLQLLVFPRRELGYYRFERDVLKTDIFNSEYYLARNEDLIPGCIELLRHFYFFGWKEGRNPSPGFDVNYYLEANPDIFQKGMNPLYHFLRYGMAEGRFAVPPPCTVHSKEPYRPWYPILITDGGRGRVIPKTDEPMFSIVVSAYNQWHYTANCLASIVDHTDFDHTPYEVILADDCSDDLTQYADRIFPGIKIAKPLGNVGYLKNTNNGVSYARGTYVVLLNNDTVVQKDWLKEVLSVFNQFPQAGIVGSLLCSPDGYTMDSGNLIMADGSGHCCGRGFLPDHPSYCYVRETHYCTAACATIKKSVWDEIGGYDERYFPSYYEDSDLGMSVREKGYQVLIQPYSRVVHFENVSHGDSALDRINERKTIFVAKWEDVLKSHPADMKNIFLSKDLSEAKKTIVVMEGWVPAWDTNAGARTFLHFIKLKKQIGYNVKLIFQDHYPEKYMEYLIEYQKMGFEVWHPAISNIPWKEWLQPRAYAIDAVFIHRYEIANLALHWVKNVLKKPVLFFNHDLHFLRLERGRATGDDSYSQKEIEDIKQSELLYLTDADVSLSPSLFEVEFLKKEHNLYNCHFIPMFAYDACNPVVDEARIQGKILYVAGFRHQPNLDALFWFIDNCWGKLLAKFPNITLHVIGSYPPPEIMRYDGQRNVYVHGYVSDDELAEHYRTCHLSVIPLLAGAGLKGKLLEALYYGIPAVGTTVALEGCPGIDAVVSPCDTPDAFIDDVSFLLTSDEECRRRSVAGQALINTYFSTSAIKQKMKTVIELALKRDQPCSVEQRGVRLDADIRGFCCEFNREEYAARNPGSYYAGLAPEVCGRLYAADDFPPLGYSVPKEQYDLPDISVPTKYDFEKRHALIISPVHTEFGQGNSVLAKLMTKILQMDGFIIHYVYYPTDKAATLDSGKKMPWDYVYEVKDQSHQLLRLKYNSNGVPLPNAHLVDDWCAPELIETVKAISGKWCFDVCLCHYIWLSKCLDILPSCTRKLLATHDVFSYRDSDPNVLGGKTHSGWYATTPSQEKKGLDRADYVLAVQDEDAEFFGTLVKPEKVRMVRTTLAKRYQPYTHPKGKVVVGYLAGVNPFNIEQLTNFYNAWFANDELVQHAELLIAGSIGKWCQEEGTMSRAKICGFVDDVSDFYSQCDILVNPDFGGTGIKIKCLEALSFGKALVATKRSMNGIYSIERYHQIQSMDDLIACLIELCRDTKKIQVLAAASRKIYDQYFTKNDATSAFGQMLNVSNLRNA